jgi:hypothetical protein
MVSKMSTCFAAITNRLLLAFWQLLGDVGVDAVLNSLADHLLKVRFEVLATFGHLVEIHKADLERNSLLEMRTFAQVAVLHIL